MRMCHVAKDVSGFPKGARIRARRASSTRRASRPSSPRLARPSRTSRRRRSCPSCGCSSHARRISATSERPRAAARSQPASAPRRGARPSARTDESTRSSSRVLPYRRRRAGSMAYGRQRIEEIPPSSSTPERVPRTRGRCPAFEDLGLQGRTGELRDGVLPSRHAHGGRERLHVAAVRARGCMSRASAVRGDPAVIERTGWNACFDARQTRAATERARAGACRGRGRSALHELCLPTRAATAE